MRINGWQLSRVVKICLIVLVQCFSIWLAFKLVGVSLKLEFLDGYLICTISICLHARWLEIIHVLYWMLITSWCIRDCFLYWIEFNWILSSDKTIPKIMCVQHTFKNKYFREYTRKMQKHEEPLALMWDLRDVNPEFSFSPQTHT